MKPQINTIANRLSLRAPQREALELLDRICDIIRLEKDADPAEALRAIKSEFPSVSDFERDFPSLCFALATGVGKTRLMGAFITYLHQAHHIRHFFILAPNLTIYNKLIADFTPGTPKYVFQGIADFAINPPEIITGDNYQSGRGVRNEGALQPRMFEGGEVHVNIFNISKINTEVRGDHMPRIRRLSEYIGESYFDYLSRLEDLVLLMDESHRYRASAGVRAINELRPILGLELTATPQIERSGSRSPEPFKNAIYSYPLSSAMQDGFVKEPAVATRENFDPALYDEDALEKIKLEDGIHIHENTKVELEVYAREHNQPAVKPFMLVVAKDIGHARAIEELIESDDFFDGRYDGKVITVESTLRGEERDETVEQLMNVEKQDNPTEVVIHVNMLKEGWDVTNLYTIVPLRTASSRTLVEQTIGRGLRLPYGRRVGVSAVDRLTIVAHDRFKEIVDDANRPDSIIRTGVVLGRDIPTQRPQIVTVEPNLNHQLTVHPNSQPATSETPVFQIHELPAAQATLNLIRERYERLPRSTSLRSPTIQEELTREVAALLTPNEIATGITLPEVTPEVVAQVVAKTVELYIESIIDIPKIVVVPRGEVSGGYRDFDLDVGNWRPQPVEGNILIHHLPTQERYRLIRGDGVAVDDRPDDYIVEQLMEYNDISYDDHAELLYKLSGQMVAHLRSYLQDENEVANVLQHNRKVMASLIYTQMQQHYEDYTTGYDVQVTRGFTTLRESTYSLPAGETPQNFREPVDDPLRIRGMLFTGFRRCLYSFQRFQSDPERRFAVLLEDESNELKWLKPATGTFRIYYGDDEPYEPDFVVETATAKYLCEPKAANEMQDETVLKKADAAAKWCVYATEHERLHNGKPWSYLLIPHTAITHNATLQGLIATYTFQQPQH